MGQVAPTWAARPSKVVVSLERGVKITKSDFSLKFDSKVGPSTLKSLSNEQKNTYKAPKTLKICDFGIPFGVQNAYFLDQGR